MSMSPKRMVVTGCKGQVVTSLIQQAPLDGRFEIIAVGRPVLDLSHPETIDAAIRAAKPDVIVSAAAYTAVDQAETDEEAATVVNGTAAGAIARVAASLDIPLVHISTDYVFDGDKPSAYVETDPVAPICAYGRSKLVGEQAVSIETSNYAILRTSWVYSPFGKNFLKTMLHLAESRDSLDVVDDQIGNPTSALDIANGVLTVAANLIASDDHSLRGLFHMTGAGEGSWADFATTIFATPAREGGSRAFVRRIPASAYPTPAKRPTNSRLNCAKLAAFHGITLPDWKQSTESVVKHLTATQNHILD